MAYKTESRKTVPLDPTPYNMRAAIRKNTQIRRQLSKVRMSLSTEEREAQQSITKGNFRLVAKLNQLKIKAKKSVEDRGRSDTLHEDEDQIHDLPKGQGSKPMEKLDSRSKLHRNKLYRQPTIAAFVAPAAEQKGSSGDSVSLEPATDRSDLQPTPDLTKYQIPSWQRAEMIAKQNQEAQKKQKIYGKKRR